MYGLNLTPTDFIYYDNIYFDVYDYNKNELKITGFNLSNVKIIKIEEGIEEILDYCFVGVNNLEKLYVPKSVKKIGKGIFGSRNVEIIYY